MVKTQPRASVTFTKEINEQLDAECERTKLSKNKLISKIIEKYFNDLEKEVNITPQPMTEEEANRLAECERGMVEMKNDIEFLKDEFSELKALILSGRDKD
jgi:hypothetical protein